MKKHEMSDVIVLIPGITGSVLERDGKEVWALSKGALFNALCSLGDSLESIELLDGVVDIYMPDFKIWERDNAKWLLKAADYPQVARRVIQAMHRQVGDLVIGEDGVARRGLLVRHLVMPNDMAGTRQVFRFLAREISPDTFVNIMDQYRPQHRAGRYAAISRPTSSREYAQAVQIAREEGLSRFDPG